MGITPHMAATNTRARRNPRSRLFPLIAVSGSTFVFAVLLILVRTNWGPLESVDHGLATDLNNLVAGQPTALTVLRAITWMGSNTVLWTLVVAGLIVLVVRRRFRLAMFLAIAGAGALTLDPILKSLVGRLRPVVAHPVARGIGNSFPSGHALGSIVCYGALILVFLPAMPRRARKTVVIVVGVLVTAIGISRIMLGVHYLSDVIGAWALGAAWLGLAAYAVEIARRESGQPVTKPLTEGLEPEAASDLKPAEPDRQAGPPRPVRVGAGITVAWILILGAVVGFGELVTHYSGGNIAGDHTIPHWLAAHRTATLTTYSAVLSTLGATQMILAVTVLTAVVALAVTHRWRPVIFVVLVMLGEVGLFMTAEAIVKRPRPDVVHLETHLPTSSYPSGHVAATLCVYATIAILVLGRTRRWWRWPFLALAVLMPILVATGRMYRGMHHPTDVLGSIILAGLLLTAMYRAIRPNADVAARPRPTRSATEPPRTGAGPSSVPPTAGANRTPAHAAHDGSAHTAHHG